MLCRCSIFCFAGPSATVNRLGRQPFFTRHCAKREAGRACVAFVAIAVVLQTLPGLFVTLLFPRSGSPHDYAVWSLTNAATLTTIAFLYEHVRLSAIRFGASQSADTAFAIVFNYLASLGVCVAIFAAFTMVPIFSDSVGINFVVLWCAASLGGLEILAAFLRARGRNIQFFVLAALRAGLTLPCCVLAVLYHAHAPTMILAYYAPGTVMLLALPILLFLKSQQDIFTLLGARLRAWRMLGSHMGTQIRFAWPVVAANAIYSLIFFEYRDLANRVDPVGSVYYLFVSDFLQRILLTVTALISAATIQYVMTAASLSADRSVQEKAALPWMGTTLTILLLFLLPAGTGIVLVYPDLISVLTTWQPWRGAGLSVLTLTVAYGGYALIQFWLQSWFMATNRTPLLLGAALTALAVCVTGILILPQRPDLSGIAAIQCVGIGASSAFLLLFGGESLLRSAPALMVAKTVCTTAIMGLCVLLLRMHMESAPPAARLASCVLSGLVVFLALTVALNVSQTRLVLAKLIGVTLSGK